MAASPLHAETITFLAELCESVGPFVFAGYGGRVARMRDEIMTAAGDDVVAGAFAAEARVDEIRRAWALAAPLPAIFPVLLQLAVAPPAGHEYAEWRDEAVALLELCMRRDPDGFAAELARQGRSDALAGVLAELEERLADTPGAG